MTILHFYIKTIEKYYKMTQTKANIVVFENNKTKMFSYTKLL